MNNWHSETCDCPHCWAEKKENTELHKKIECILKGIKYTSKFNLKRWNEM